MQIKPSRKNVFISLFSFVLLTALIALTVSALASDSEVSIRLSDSGIMVDGAKASTSSSSAVYLSNDIIYYEDSDAYDSGNPYGEGTVSERHSAAEAAAHTVVNITRAGAYRISGTLSRGQIFIDLGKDAKSDPDAVVTLILDNADITCTVAPAVFFYRAYECDQAWVSYDDGETEGYDASATQDTAKAGANVIIADGSVNHVTGSHVARIYKDNGDKKKLHKYDAAFYSRMSMNINGGPAGTGVLDIAADNEGLDSEVHLTINGGKINIQAQNDGINTNEDNVSVTTINGGAVHIVAGLGSEGDGIDSNGYLVINGGVVIAIAKPQSDSGLDSDRGSYINGGYVVATGSTMDWAESDSRQVTMNLQFAYAQNADEAIIVTDLAGKVIFAYDPDKDETTGTYNWGYQGAVISCPEFQVGETYNVYVGGDVQGTEADGIYDASTVTGFSGAVRQQYTGTDVGMGGHGGGMRPGGMWPDGGGMEPPGGMRPDGGGMTRPEGMRPGGGGMVPPDSMRPDGGGMVPPDGMRPDGGGMMPPDGMRPDGGADANAPASVLFYMTDKVNAFSGVTDETETSGKIFTDVADDAYYSKPIRWAAAQGIAAGTSPTTFSPDLTCDCAQILTFLWRAARSPMPENSGGILSVSEDAYYYQAVLWASEQSIISAGAFLPNDPCTRATAVYYLWKASGAPAAATSTAFTDIPTDAEYAQAVAWAVEKGITVGTSNTTFSPDITCTRGQIAAFLYRTFAE